MFRDSQVEKRKGNRVRRGGRKKGSSRCFAIKQNQPRRVSQKRWRFENILRHKKKQNWKDGLQTLSHSYRAGLEFTSRDKWSMRRDKQPVSVVPAARPWWTGWRSECDWPIERKTRYQQVTLTSVVLYFVFMICFSGFRRATLDECDSWKAEDGK